MIVVAVAALDVGGTASAPVITLVKNSGRVAAAVIAAVLAIPLPVLVTPLVLPLVVLEVPDAIELLLIALLLMVPVLTLFAVLLDVVALLVVVSAVPLATIPPVLAPPLVVTVPVPAVAPFVVPEVLMVVLVPLAGIADPLLGVEVIAARAQHIQLLHTQHGADGPDAAATAALSELQCHRSGDAARRGMNVCRCARDIRGDDSGLHLTCLRVDHDHPSGSGGCVHQRHFFSASQGGRKNIVRYRAVGRVHLIAIRSGGGRVDGVAVAAAACQHQQQ